MDMTRTHNAHLCSAVCSQIVLKCLSLSRIGRPYTLWSVNKLARAVAKWTKILCQTVGAFFISCIQCTSECRQHCYVGNTAQQSRSGLFQDSVLPETLKTQNQHHEELLCIFGSHTFVPISWMCKKQTSVSYCSREAEIISRCKFAHGRYSPSHSPGFHD